MLIPDLLRQQKDLLPYEQRRPKEFEAVVTLLVNEQHLPEKYRDHALTNSRNYKDMRECHIEPDWLLVYKISKETLILRLIRTGSHSDLF